MMLDTEFEGSGKYLPELDDCEHSNAASTALYDLHLLRVSISTCGNFA